tara:strand:- start:449 stop:1003 length:555 start_codon:yes stop_codon:yes gene_type:complete
MIKKFKSFAEDKQLDDFEEELINADCPEKDTVEIKKEEKMKTLKQHIKEQSKYGKGNVGTPEVNAVEDGNIGVHNIHDKDVLERVNAFVGSIADLEYIKPQQAVDSLREKLNRIGLTVSPVNMEGTSGKVSAKVSQFGGRFGKDTDGSDLNDDGISHKKEGGLNLEVSYETLKNGSSKVYAKLV